MFTIKVAEESIGVVCMFKADEGVIHISFVDSGFEQARAVVKPLGFMMTKEDISMNLVRLSRMLI